MSKSLLMGCMDKLMFRDDEGYIDWFKIVLILFVAVVAVAFSDRWLGWVHSNFSTAHNAYQGYGQNYNSYQFPDYQIMM